MKLTGVEEKEAIRRLQQLASEQNQKLIDAAQRILAIEKALAPRA
jgi:AmiR/NasT family two-component response regulator